MNTSALELPGPRTRRKYSPEFRASVVQACRAPAVSVAAVAMANGLNANLVRRWLHEARHSPTSGRIASGGSANPFTAPAAAAFIPVAMPAAASAPIVPVTPAADIRIELQRGACTVKVSWPSCAATECTAWLHDLTSGLCR